MEKDDFIRLWHRHMNLWLLAMLCHSIYKLLCASVYQNILEIVIFCSKIFNLKLFYDKNISLLVIFVSLSIALKRAGIECAHLPFMNEIEYQKKKIFFFFVNILEKSLHIFQTIYGSFFLFSFALK